MLTIQTICYRSKRDRRLTVPFEQSYGVCNRHKSRRVSRVLVDFGSDESFRKASSKFKEHYGLSISPSYVRNTTLTHAGIATTYLEEMDLEESTDSRPIISQTDGTMLPIVEINESFSDKRKGKSLVYKEARLSLAYRNGDVDPCYRGTFGDKQESGKQLRWCACKVGLNDNDNVHCIGDGAKWIYEQVGDQFGDQATYLIDFYHLCDYLHEASTQISKCSAKQKEWVQRQKSRMMLNKVGEVISELETYIIRDKTDSNPAFKCYRYMINRRGQFDYKNALNNRLPIGSGKIESAHRNVLQKRLKIPGAWWKKDNAQKMIQLRALRANNDWNDMWKSLQSVA